LDTSLKEQQIANDKCAYENVVINNPLRDTDVLVEESMCQNDDYDMGF